MAYEVFRCATSVDISELSRLLWQQHVPHKIHQLGSWQLVSVADEAALHAANQIVDAWRKGEQLDVQVVQSSRRDSMQQVVNQMGGVPITSILCLFSLIGFAATQWLEWDTLLRIISFQAFELQGNYLYVQAPFEAILQGQWWRLITPAFIHFGWLHIAFNTLWVLDFGRCIERRQGSLRLIVLFVLFALVSNIAQAVFAEQLFGGMSGVIYGLLGYCFAYNKRNPSALPCVNNSLFGFMVAWLLLCLSGIVTVLGFGSIANAAHVGGLLSGLACGMLWPLSRENSNDVR